MGPWDPWAMIFMGQKALGMGPITDFLLIWNFRMGLQDTGS